MEFRICHGGSVYSCVTTCLCLQFVNKHSVWGAKDLLRSNRDFDKKHQQTLTDNSFSLCYCVLFLCLHLCNTFTLTEQNCVHISARSFKESILSHRACTYYTHRHTVMNRNYKVSWQLEVAYSDVVLLLCVVFGHLVHFLLFTLSQESYPCFSKTSVMNEVILEGETVFGLWKGSVIATDWVFVWNFAFWIVKVSHHLMLRVHSAQVYLGCFKGIDGSFANASMLSFLALSWMRILIPHLYGKYKATASWWLN